MSLFPGPVRILFLSESPSLIERQLAGEALSLAQAGPLRQEISTDEITPLPALVHFDAALGEHAHTGTTCGGVRPIGRGALQAAGIRVLVAGKRYGKGSSREHSPVAELAAGVRLVVATSFERIYRQNADNLGLFTSTDFGLVERLQRGETLALEDLLRGREPQAASILRAGGLLAYGRQHMAGLPRQAAPAATGPRTLFDKIIDRHLLAGGQFVSADWRFIHEIYTGMAAHLLHQAFGDALALHEPQGILAFEDHFSYAHASPAHVNGGLLPNVRRLSEAHRAFVARHGLAHQGYQQALPAGDAVNTGSQGISHALMLEQHALPGQLVAGTDSHTPHAGALGCVAFGVGTTDMANAFVTGALRFTRPPNLKVQVNGRLAAGVSAKDLVLHLLARPEVRAGACVGRAIEFAGEGVRALGLDERATLTNMVAELGGFTGLVAPDETTLRFLRERRGITFALEGWMHSDDGAAWERVIEIDAATLSPMVARPGDPGLGLPLSELREPVRIGIAYGGSCTAGKLEDFEAYHEVLAWGREHGLRAAPGVRLILQFGTEAVRDECTRRGYLATFEAVGAELLQPACGACSNCGPGVSTRADEVTVSAINRNFPGRSGPGGVWLASPATVAASALAGELVSFAQLRAARPAPFPPPPAGIGSAA